MLYLKASNEIEVLDSFNGEKGIFLKTFAISDRRNKNGWRATWESILKHIKSFQDNERPGIQYEKCVGTDCDLDHTDGTTKENNVNVQEEFRVTTIVDHTLDYEDHKAFFIHKLEPGPIPLEFLEKVKSGEVDSVSPSIWPEAGGFDILGTMPNGLPKLGVHEWEGLHDAFLTKNPAFGDEAKITAICEGNDCHMKLLTAAQLKADDNLSHLQQVPILISHKDKLRFVSVTKSIAATLQANLENDIAITEESLLRAINEAKEKSTADSSFSSCSCSKNYMTLTATEEKELRDNLKSNEEKVKELESKFKAQEDEKKELEAKLKASEENNDDEKVTAAKKAQDEAEKEKDEAVEARKATEEEKEKLEAKIKEPLIASILLKAKDNLSDSEVSRLETSLKAKTIDEVNEVITMTNLSGQTIETPTHFDFPGESTGPLAGKSLEDTFGEDN
ncbi:MAG: hypothetical protein JKY15_02035 [Deltaproteobacteria bacterium]|nr:hypothetical protein [Deltaproteobacteria bacterium]